MDANANHPLTLGTYQDRDERSLDLKILDAGSLNEIFEILMNAIGSRAWTVFENLLTAQEYRERRSREREMAPWSQFDLDLLRRLLPAAKDLRQGSDPIKPSVRLEGIIESMEEVKKIGERGY